MRVASPSLAIGLISLGLAVPAPVGAQASLQAAQQTGAQAAQQTRRQAAPEPGAQPGPEPGAQPAAGPGARPEDTEIWEPVPPAVGIGVGVGVGIGIGIGVGGSAGATAATQGIPADAIVLFDGTDLREWVNTRDGASASWTVADGVMTVDKAAGNIETRRRFGSYQLHLEWRVPEFTTGAGQSRGNSGVFMASTGSGDAGYELQILDSFENATYVNGMAASVYKQSIPLVNPSLPPGAWQSYDIVWTAPDFAGDGELVSPARVTAFFNGILVQNDFALEGETVYIGTPRYRAHGDSPIKLQAHGDPSPPISFRNIWVRPLP